jgi:GNAT superfamily N-acetyltransferase
MGGIVRTLETFRQGETIRRMVDIDGAQVLLTFGSMTEGCRAAAGYNGETIAYAQWCKERGAGDWYTLRTWRMHTREPWRRKGIMTALWGMATEAGYTIETAEWWISPYTRDGEAFVKAWDGLPFVDSWAA